MRQADIAVIHLESIPTELFTGFTESIASEKLNLQVHLREDGGTFAALECTRLPTSLTEYKNQWVTNKYSQRGNMQILISH